MKDFFIKMPSEAINILLKIAFSFVLWFYYSVLALICQIVPYKYRSKSIRNETVLMTGAGSGLGKSLSKKLANQGAKLVLIDIDTPANQKTAEEIIESGGQAFAYTCDLSNREEIYRVADEVKKKKRSFLFLNR